MKKRLNTTLGFYSPSFLRLHVGSDKSLQDLNKLNDDFTESVYLHEFTHFIQDVTTVYGLSNICIVVDYMKFVNNHLIGLPAKGFIAPVKPIPMAADNVDINLQFASIYNGTGDDNEANFTNHIISNKNITTNTRPINIEIVNIDYKTPGGSKKQFEFGALCIVESMAFIIESECYPNCEPSPDLPYHSAEKLVELIHPSFGKDRLNVLALCDASLKTFHPGLFFYKTLIKIRDNNATFHHPEDIYAYCVINHDAINFHGATDLKSLLNIQSKMAIDQITSYFNDPYFQPVKDWLKSVLNLAVNYRLNNETFPIEIARGGKLSSNSAFANFLTSVGTPLVTNNLDEVTLFDSKQNISSTNYSLIWAIDQINSIFWGIQRNCEMVNFCTNNKINTDNRCNNSPWDRANDSQLCAFAQVWRHWGLSGYYPI